MGKIYIKQHNTYQYYGAIHIHTIFSDGSGDVISISKAAKEAGLDWIIITDHNSMEIQEGIYNGVYVIKGEEISPNDSNHYLALGINETIEPDEDSQTNVNNVRKFGGFGFAAHPDEGTNKNGKARQNHWKPIRWTDKKVIPDGIEIWNWFSSWGDNLDESNIFTLAFAYFFKNKIISDPPKDSIKWWDRLNSEFSQIIPAIGSSDAHALKIYKYILPLTVFPYKTCFQAITNVINLKEPLSEDFLEAKEQILEAIKCGKNIIINRKINNKLPEIDITNGNKTVICGDSLILNENTYFELKADSQVGLKLFCNGEEIADIETKRCRIPIQKKGKYRAEIFYNGKGFIYTNPIKVI